MWSETAFRNAGISKSSYRLIDALSLNFPSDSFTVFANTAFEKTPAWACRDNLSVNSIVPTGRGKRAFWEFFGSTRQVMTGDFDVWFSTTHAVPLGRKIPSVAVIHDMIPLLFPQFQDWSQSAYLRLALIYVAKRADRVVTNSVQTKSDIARLAKVDPAKILVVPFGPGATFTPRDRNAIEAKELADIPYTRYFFALGTLEPRKNLGALFEALALLNEPQYSDVGIVVGGGKGWREQGIFDTLDKLGVGNRVTFLGYVPDERLPTLFSASEGFVFPSVYEGFGMPLVESMQLGTLILTGDRGAMKEVAGQEAIFFQPEVASSIASAMKIALGMPPQLRCEITNRAKIRAMRFNWNDAAIQTHVMLEALAAGK